jgi:hypothetical protein
VHYVESYGPSRWTGAGHADGEKDGYRDTNHDERT